MPWLWITSPPLKSTTLLILPCPDVGRTTTCVSQPRIFLRIDHRVISLWSPALPTLQAVHAIYLPLIFHLVFWVCALFEGCVATNCASRAFIQCLSSDLSPRYFSVQRTTTSAAVHSFHNILICPSCFESAYFHSRVHAYYHLCKLEISILVVPCMIRTNDLSHRSLEHYQLCYRDFGGELTNSSGIDVLSNYYMC